MGTHINKTNKHWVTIATQFVCIKRRDTVVQRVWRDEWWLGANGVTQTAWTRDEGEVWGAGWVADTQRCAVPAHASDGLSLHQTTGARGRIIVACHWAIMRYFANARYMQTAHANQSPWMVCLFTNVRIP